MELKTAVLTTTFLLALSSVTVYAEAEKSVPKPAAPVATATVMSTPTSVGSKPTDAKKSGPKPSSSSDPTIVSGKVVETLDGGNYSYFLMEKDGKKAWVAVPTYKAKVGDEITFRPGTQMGEFRSTLLKRTFEDIVFSAGPVLPEGATGSDDFLMKRAHSTQPAAGETSAPGAGPKVKTATKPEYLSGKVVEKMDGGGYSYFLLEKDGKKTWVAAPPTEGKVGDMISFQPGFEMKDFKSRILNRTFDSIMFTDGLPGDAKQNTEQKKVPAVTGKPLDKAGNPLDVQVAKATGANGYTVAELYGKSGELNGKEVVVQGKVVKVSKQIMGKNWVHLQDGSGDAAAGTNNMVTTTQDIAVVGEVVTATGKLAKDKDFGGGYQYTVIIEETKLVKK